MIKVGYSLTQLVELAWEDLTALHKAIERTPSLAAQDSIIAELDELHRRYTGLFQQWVARGRK